MTPLDDSAARAGHPPAFELRLGLAALPRRVRELLDLLACRSCQAAAAPCLEAWILPEGHHPDPVLPGFDALFTRILRKVASFESLEGQAGRRHQADELADELLACPLADRTGRLGETRGRSLELVEALLARAGASLPAEPARADDAVQLALHLLPLLEVPSWQASLRNGAQVRAWALLGHVASLRGDTLEARQAFEQAAHLAAGDRLGTLDEADLLHRQALDLRRQGRPGEALALLHRAAELASDHGEVDLEIACRCERAAILVDLGDFLAARAALAWALGLAERSGLAAEAGTLRRQLAAVLLAGGQGDAACELLRDAPDPGLSRPSPGPAAEVHEATTPAPAGQGAGEDPA